MEWMDGMGQWFEAAASDPEQLRLGYSLALGLAVFLLVSGISLLVSGVWNPLRKRVDAVAAGKPTRSHKLVMRSRSAIAHLGDVLSPKTHSKREQLERLLTRAGFRAPHAMRAFLGIKLATMVLAPGLLVTGGWFAQVSPLEMIPYALAFAVLGFVAPDIVLVRLVRRRQAALRKALPDAMDLLVVCSEAGLGLNAGIQRVADEMDLTHPELAQEFNLYSLQSRSGIDGRAALKNLYERTGLDEIQSLVAMLLQSLRFGTSIGETLRLFSSEMRDKRLQRAEERAAKVSTFMLFPTVFCIMPSFLLVVLGPVILGLIAALSTFG